MTICESIGERQTLKKMTSASGMKSGRVSMIWTIFLNPQPHARRFAVGELDGGS
jgi:hypothetical protein